MNAYKTYKYLKIIEDDTVLFNEVALAVATNLKQKASHCNNKIIKFILTRAAHIVTYRLYHGTLSRNTLTLALSIS